MNTETNWNLSVSEAIALQSALRDRVRTVDDFDPGNVRAVAGIDVSLKEQGTAAIVVLSYPDLKPIEDAVASLPITFPYVPGLLSFRETPLVLAAFEKLSVRPDLLLVDGQGYAHPRRFGIACHLGVLLDIPSIGVAKSVLVGKFEPPGDVPGDQAPLIHRGETVGVALRSKVRTNPLIVSVGHRISLSTAVGFVQGCLRGYRLPEPTRAAHNRAGSIRPSTAAEP